MLRLDQLQPGTRRKHAQRAQRRAYQAQGDKVKFWWPKPSGGASTYDIVVSKNHKKDWSRLATGYRQNVVHIKNADASKTYYIAVQACNHSGENGKRVCSGWRNSAAGKLTPPDPVSSITAWASGDDHRDLNAIWSAVDSSDYYHATYSCKSGESIALGDGHTNIQTNSRVVDIGKPADGCWVGVRACYNNGACSQWRSSAPANPT